MPHATEQIANGDGSDSKTLSHLTSYPAVSDGINTFKSNPYGKKSLEIVDNAYARFGKPVEPYLETPYSYVKPYANKADELGSRALKTVDGHFPIVTEKTDTIIEKAKSTVFWPYTYLNETWSDEYNKTASHNNRGKGLGTSAMAFVSLELRVASDFFHYVANNLHKTKDQASEMADAAADKASEYGKYGKEKANEAADTISKKTNEAADTASKKTGELTDAASKKANEAADTASKKTNELTDAASKKANEAADTASKKTDEAKNAASKKTDEAKSQVNQTKQQVQK